MRFALEASLYGFLVLIIIGIVLGVVFVRWVWTARQDPLSLFPYTKRPPEAALNHIKQQCRNFLKQEEKLPDEMQYWLDQVQEKTKDSQQEYHQLCKRRERVWHHLDHLSQTMTFVEKVRGKFRHPGYCAGVEEYESLGVKIGEEWERLELRDQLLLQTLQQQLQPTSQHELEAEPTVTSEG